jgi:hypothetical protein
MVERLHYVRISESIIPLELIVVCSTNAGDVVGFVDQPSGFVVGDDDFRPPTEIGEDV